MPKPAFVGAVQELKSFEQSFILDPNFWAKYSDPAKLSWNAVKFDKTEKTSVPQERGVYAFVVQPAVIGFPVHGYLLYVGETGDKKKSDLRKRFGQYFHEQAHKKRAAVHYFLNCWSGHLYFHFAQIKNPSVSTKKIEKLLCDALLPPFTSNDFSPVMRTRMKAFRST